MGEVSDNWPNYLLGTNLYKTLTSCCYSFLIILQSTNTTAVIWQISFSKFLEVLLAFTWARAIGNF